MILLAGYVVIAIVCAFFASTPGGRWSAETEKFFFYYFVHAAGVWTAYRVLAAFARGVACDPRDHKRPAQRPAVVVRKEDPFIAWMQSLGKDWRTVSPKELTALAVDELEIRQGSR